MVFGDILSVRLGVYICGLGYVVNEVGVCGLLNSREVCVRARRGD